MCFPIITQHSNPLQPQAHTHFPHTPTPYPIYPTATLTYLSLYTLLYINRHPHTLIVNLTSLFLTSYTHPIPINGPTSISDTWYALNISYSTTNTLTTLTQPHSPLYSTAKHSTFTQPSPTSHSQSYSNRLLHPRLSPILPRLIYTHTLYTQSPKPQSTLHTQLHLSSSLPLTWIFCWPF